jgi:hypothetical protein
MDVQPKHRQYHAGVPADNLGLPDLGAHHARTYKRVCPRTHLLALRGLLLSGD